MTKRKAKVLALVAAGSLLAAALFGWKLMGLQAGAKTHPGPVTPVRIEFWHGMAEDSLHGKTLNELVRQFNAEHKEIQVDASYQGSYADLQKKTLSAVEAGIGPTIIQATDNMLPDLIGGGLARPLDDLVPKAELADYPANLLEQVSYQGRHYALPFNRGAAVLFYNQRLVPTAPRTWAEFRTAAMKATGKQRAGVAFTPDVYSFGSFYVGAGGNWMANGRLAVADPVGVKALQSMQEMVNNGSAVLLKPMEYASDYLNQGRAAMIISTTASMAYMKNVNGDPIATAPVPAGPDGVRTLGSGANAVILAKSTPAEAKAAATFLLWLTGRDATLRFAMAGTGYGPVRLSALQDPRWTSYVQAHPDAAVLGTELTRAVPSPNVRGWVQVQKALTQAVQDALVGHRPAGAALETAVSSAEAYLKQQ